jgi:hypothetical protein
MARSLQKLLGGTMQAGSTLWWMSPPKETRNVAAEGEENGELHE